MVEPKKKKRKRNNLPLPLGETVADATGARVLRSSSSPDKSPGQKPSPSPLAKAKKPKKPRTKLKGKRLTPQNAHARKAELTATLAGGRLKKKKPKYDYLDYKNWDQYVLPVGDSYAATNMLKATPHKLSELDEEHLACDLDEMQLDPEEARAMVEEALEVMSEDSFTEQHVKIKDPTLKKQFGEFHEKTHVIADLETELQKADSVVALKWEPLNTSMPTALNKDQELKGNYIMKVKVTRKLAKATADKLRDEVKSKDEVVSGRNMPDDVAEEFVEVIPQSDWVETMFKPAILATVQQTAVNMFKKVDVKKDPNQKKPDKEGGFIDVSNEGVTVVVEDGNEVNKLKYIPERQVAHGDIYEKEEYEDDDGNIKERFKIDRKTGNRIKIDYKQVEKDTYVVKEKWLGYCNKTMLVTELEPAFVRKNFSKTLINHVKHMSRKESSKWIVIPPGDDKVHTNVPQDLQTSIQMKYRQNEGERTCLVYSFASALHYAGARQEASELYRKANRIIEKPNTVQVFSDAVVGRSEHLKFTILTPHEWDILGNGERDLVLVSLRGDDGKEDHCVTLYGRYIFDSNFDRALPLTREALDLCCSSDDTKSTFDSVVEARWFHNFDLFLNELTKKKHKKKKTKKQKHTA